jgi:hypothetical protein
MVGTGNEAHVESEVAAFCEKRSEIKCLFDVLLHCQLG